MVNSQESFNTNNPIFQSQASRDTYMAVEFLASKMPAWKAIKFKLKPQPTTPVPVQINLNEINQKKLGPGAYKISTLSKGPEHRFSSVPRFSRTDKIKLMLPNLNKITQDTIQKGKKIYKRNLDTSPYTLTNKQIKLKNLAQSRAISLVSAQTTREILQKNEVKRKLKKIIEKEVKYKRWTSKKFYIKAEKAWSILFVCIGLAQNINKIRNIKRNYKNPFILYTNILYQASIEKNTLEVEKIG
jgi:hypothetical protein